MSYMSKKNLLNILVEVGVFFGYINYTKSKYAPKTTDLQSWVFVILAFIVIGMILVFTVQIIFHIISTINTWIQNNRTDSESVKKILFLSLFIDEKDTVINLKSNKISNTFIVCGFILFIIVLVKEPSNFFIVQFLLGIFWFSAIIEAVAKIYFYENGMLHE